MLQKQQTALLSFINIVLKEESIKEAVNMVEKQYMFTQSEGKVIERVIEDDNAAVNHMILRQTEALPEHYSNSNVYMIVVRGSVTLKLDEQEGHTYPAGSIITIPIKTKMNVSNESEEVLEIFVVKAPGPRTMKQ